MCDDIPFFLRGVVQQSGCRFCGVMRINKKCESPDDVYLFNDDHVTGGSFGPVRAQLTPATYIQSLNRLRASFGATLFNYVPLVMLVTDPELGQ